MLRASYRKYYIHVHGALHYASYLLLSYTLVEDDVCKNSALIARQLEFSDGALAKKVSLAIPDHAFGQASDDILRSVLFEKDALGNFIPVRMQVGVIYYLSLLLLDDFYGC